MTDHKIRIRQVLDATGVYQSTEPLLNGEISAYEEGLTMLLGEFQRVEQDLFVESATEQGLGRRESLFRAKGTGGTAESLRAQLAEREKIRSCLVGELAQRLLASGVTGEIVEGYQDGILIRVSEWNGPDKTQAQLEIQALMPAHLPCYFEEV